MSASVSNDGAGGTAADTHHNPRSGLRQFRLRACQSCARSEIKCEWPIERGTNACNRCAKVKSSCVLPPLTDRKRRGPSARVRKLEDKLQGIMSLLSVGERNPPHPPQPRGQHEGEAQDPSESQRRLYPPSPTSLANPSPLAAPVAQPQTEAIQIVPGFVLSFAEADAIVDLYRRSYSPYFPFVPIPVTAAAADLEQASPFPLRTILQVAAPQTAVVQRSVDRWFRQHIAQRSQATDLLHLASTLVLDLGLHTDPNPYGAGRQSFLPDAIRRVKGSAKDRHNLDDMRAMLGFFYLNSVVSILFQRTRNSMYTPYLLHCCDILLSAQEHDSDKFLVALVRMQRLIGRVADAFPSPESDDTQLSMNGSASMMMSTAQKELDALARSQPSEVQCNASSSHAPAPRSDDPRKSTARTEALSRCLQAVADFFAAYANIPLDSLGHMPLVATAYMAFAFVTASRILMLNDADWDVELAGRTFDFSATCQSFSDRFRQADSLAKSLGRRRRFKDGDDSQSVLSTYSNKILWVRQWYLAKVSAADTASDVGEGRDRANDHIVAVSSGMGIGHSLPSHSTPSLALQELDEEFWNTLLGPEASNSWES
ncbi:hypothetical protein C8A03DRAFT_48123 [Achaetomium macrosporum]|uniref:Zn(2)-C6 fungal-type domain-containing protein n=1 Tax=Achaetomium macrosporum TaxID=79813 RepID=A0AAN7H9V5_9PEZI|nr:hypothetical protein C8A03DRAFT_48123 [Achaetomium macrosporum]